MHLHFLSFQNVPPKAGTPVVGVAAPPAGPGNAPAPQASAPGGGLIMLLPILMLAPFLFLQFRRQKKDQEARGKLKKGDRVVSQSGLVGELVELDDRFAKVKLDKAMPAVTMLASTIAPLEATPEPKKDDLKDLKSAKAAAEKK